MIRIASNDDSLDNVDKNIIQILQDNFPMVEHPWKVVGRKLNLTEYQVLNRLQRLSEQGVIRKIGAVVDSSKIGLAAATLVACRVPQNRIAEVSSIINQYSGVSHNYEREHEYNIWFTLKASSQHELNTTLEEILQRTSIAKNDYLSFPTKNCFKIQVRFQII